ncbi:twin-arginine translocation signal domain-containing protein [Halobellus ruber]|uniref:Twin-arginine translocation signal domain-containing protein n=1 Tax=Halobellus ruber TaxID=2761102 RepID=A0A7J9SLT3_9EURY|nr:twin-arginine translocation signal domain-containing protein [Halobellus ruber]MBB6647492.1 twin-arginine translocation signal domain-containing protein [Halobellus ruber]
MPSSTPRPTRRQFLRSAAALAGVGAVAGCGGTAESSGTAVSRPDPEPPEDALTDPATVVLRTAPDEAVLREDDDTETDSEARIDEWRHSLIADRGTAASVSVADVDGAGAARQFLADTDFDAETVYVEGHVVGECYDRRLCWVRWTTERVETSYARVLRDADVACSADARVGVTHLIRLPVALDPGQVSRFSSRGGSGRCRTSPADGSNRSTEGGS